MIIKADWFKTLPMVIAHRGASFYAPENTLAAFELAYHQGAQAIELDVKLTKDGHAVIMHDATVDRTTTGRGKVAGLRLDEIQSLDAGVWKAPHYRNTAVPTLRETLEKMAGKLLLNLELTNYTTPLDRLPTTAIQLIHQAGVESRVLLSSFNPLTVMRAHRLAPDLPIGLLIHSKQPQLTRWLLAHLVSHQAWHPQEALLKAADDVISIHKRGALVNVWTVNDRDRMEQLIHWKVDGIMTDDPATLLQVWRATGRTS